MSESARMKAAGEGHTLQTSWAAVAVRISRAGGDATCDPSILEERIQVARSSHNITRSLKNGCSHQLKET